MDRQAERQKKTGQNSRHTPDRDKYTDIKTKTQTDIKTKRQTDRKTKRQTDRKTKRQTVTERPRDKQTERLAFKRHTDKKADCRDRQKDW